MRVWALRAAVMGAVIGAAATCDDGEYEPELSYAMATEEVIEIFCDDSRDCDCEESVHASEADCRASVRQFMENLEADATRNNLSYAETCMKETLDHLHARGCARPSDMQACRERCSVFGGTLNRDRVCSDFGPYASDCYSAYACVGICVGGDCQPYELPERTGVVAAGAQCTADDQCESGHECRASECKPELPIVCGAPVSLG